MAAPPFSFDTRRDYIIWLGTECVGFVFVFSAIYFIIYVGFLGWLIGNEVIHEESRLRDIELGSLEAGETIQFQEKNLPGYQTYL
ncbi:hypothetical protein YC2023_031811 [Brassica napus]